jgi:hypothetical protein
VTAAGAERLAQTGIALGERSIQWGRRPPHPTSCWLTDRDLALFAALHDYRYLTTGLICSLLWGRETSAVRRRLKKLHDAGYIDKLRPYTPHGHGTTEWIYRLAAAGHQRLSQRKPAVDRLPAVLGSIAYVEHDLQLNALITRLATLAADAQGTLTGQRGLLAEAPFAWLGPVRGRYDPRTQPVGIERSAAATLPAGHLIRQGTSSRGPLEPDATLIGTEEAGGRPSAILLEYDRTRRPSKQTLRYRRYDHLLTQGWRHTHFAAHEGEPAVIFVCQDDKTAHQFLLAADAHLTAWLGPTQADPRDGHYPAREQTAFTTRQRLHNADWQMLQVPRLPPALRPPRQASSRRIRFPFDRYFATPRHFD